MDLGRPFRLIAVAALALGAALVASPASAQNQPPPPGEPSITVVGSGAVSARPDTAEVTSGVVTQAPTAAQALAANSAGMDKVLKAVAGLGVSERDVQTSNLNVTPLRRQGRQEPQPAEIVGYEVSNQVRIKVRDLARLGGLLDAVIGQGANLLGGVSFTIADPDPLFDQARAKAMADARHKAEVYAGAGGVFVGRILSISEAASPLPRFDSPRMMTAAAGVPVAPGEQDLHVTVTVRYAIK